MIRKKYFSDPIKLANKKCEVGNIDIYIIMIYYVVVMQWLLNKK